MDHLQNKLWVVYWVCRGIKQQFTSMLSQMISCHLLKAKTQISSGRGHRKPQEPSAHGAKLKDFEINSSWSIGIRMLQLHLRSAECKWLYTPPGILFRKRADGFSLHYSHVSSSAVSIYGFEVPSTKVMLLNRRERRPWYLELWQGPCLALPSNPPPHHQHPFYHHSSIPPRGSC